MYEIRMIRIHVFYKLGEIFFFLRLYFLISIIFCSESNNENLIESTKNSTQNVANNTTEDRENDEGNYSIFDNYATASRIGINRNYDIV